MASCWLSRKPTSANSIVSLGIIPQSSGYGMAKLLTTSLYIENPTGGCGTDVAGGAVIPVSCVGVQAITMNPKSRIMEIPKVPFILLLINFTVPPYTNSITNSQQLLDYLFVIILLTRVGENEACLMVRKYTEEELIKSLSQVGREDMHARDLSPRTEEVSVLSEAVIPKESGRITTIHRKVCAQKAKVSLNDLKRR